jgi:hypothetical protein
MNSDHVLELASDVADRLRTGLLPRAADARIADETWQAFVDMGLDRMDNDLDPSLRVLTTLARGCPSSAWHLAQSGEEPVDAVVQARLAAVMLGGALAAVDDYDAFVRSRISEPVPAPSGDQETDLRRRLGMAIGRLETAQCILDEAALLAEDPNLLGALSKEVTRMAYATIQELVLPVAGSTRDTERLTRNVAAMVTLWSHPTCAPDDQVSRSLARERLGLTSSPTT